MRCAFVRLFAANIAQPFGLKNLQCVPPIFAEIDYVITRSRGVLVCATSTRSTTSLATLCQHTQHLRIPRANHGDDDDDKTACQSASCPVHASKRPLSCASSSDLSTPRSATPVNYPGTSSQPPSPKKYRSALSSESRLRGAASSTALKRAKTPTSLDVPSDGSRSRSGTPVPHSPHSLGASLESEMDVSRVDPESVLVDATNVCDDPDLSLDGEANLNILDGLERTELGKGTEDKVLVSVR